jgi:hypothetical protein
MQIGELKEKLTHKKMGKDSTTNSFSSIKKADTQSSFVDEDIYKQIKEDSQYPLKALKSSGDSGKLIKKLLNTISLLQNDLSIKNLTIRRLQGENQNLKLQLEGGKLRTSKSPLNLRISKNKGDF